METAQELGYPTNYPDQIWRVHDGESFILDCPDAVATHTVASWYRLWAGELPDEIEEDTDTPISDEMSEEELLRALMNLNDDLLVPFEELDARGQLMERAGTEAMRRAMNAPLVIEDYTVLTEEALLYQMHANDDHVAAGELARRRVLRSVGPMAMD